MSQKVKVLHLIYCFDIGGLEKVMAECINHLPETFEHTIVSLTKITQYANESLNYPVEMIELNKKTGNDFSLYWKLYQLLKKIKPDVLHSYNLPTLEYQLIGFLAGIKIRIHAEHGRDINDPQGINKKYNFLRRIINPFIHHWIAVSKDLQYWLINTVKLPHKKVKLIYNGVDTEHFKSSIRKNNNKEKIVIGTIGRFDPVKNQKILVDVFNQIRYQQPELAEKLQITIIGNGAEYQNIKQLVAHEKLQKYFLLPGVQYNIAEILNDFDIFVLPSIAEGVPMTLLEAMSMGIPSVCSRVGGIPEVLNDKTGILVKPESSKELVQALISLMKNKKMMLQLGKNARQYVIDNLSIQTMVKQYEQLYKQ